MALQIFSAKFSHFRFHEVIFTTKILCFLPVDFWPSCDARSIFLSVEQCLTLKGAKDTNFMHDFFSERVETRNTRLKLRSNKKHQSRIVLEMTSRHQPQAAPKTLRPRKKKEREEILFRQPFLFAAVIKMSLFLYGLGQKKWNARLMERDTPISMAHI